MLLIPNVSADPLQQQTLVLDNGSTFTFTLYYVPLQIGWFITSLTYGSFTLQGLRVTVSPNMLYQFKNQIPFGIACLPNSVNREPTQLQDFEAGAFSLYVLTAAEVAQYTTLLQGGKVA